MRVHRSEQQEVVERFLAAVTTGDVQGLMDVLAPDVVLIADGGGVAQAVRVPVYGAKKVTNLLRSFPQAALNPKIALLWLNGALGIRIDDEAGGPSLISLVVEDGRIARIFAMRNPDKLGHLEEETRLAR
jgi:RNA polymerase sigma-70 factor (ECF subfamily)